MKTRSGRGGSRGFALLLVLWTLVLVSLLVTQMLSNGRHEARIAANLANAARAESDADGAVFETIFRLLDTGPDHWGILDKDHHLNLADGEAVVHVESEAGKVNPNTVPPDLLAALIEGVGVEKKEAAGLALAIIQWREAPESAAARQSLDQTYRAAGLDYRPPAEQIQSIDELSLVLGMTPRILAALRPHLTLSVAGIPNPDLADPVVAKALKRLAIDPDEQPPHGMGLEAVTIIVDMRMKSGGRFIRHVIARLGAGYPRGYAITVWEKLPVS